VCRKFRPVLSSAVRHGHVALRESRSIQKETVSVKTFKLSLALALVLLPLSAFAAVPWSASPGAGALDEDSVALADANTAPLQFKGTATGTIISRIPLNDTTATGYPSWATMEIRGYDPDPSTTVRVKLMRISGGTVSTVATCSLADNASVQTLTCSIPQVDFNSGYVYVVQTEVIRSSTSYAPFITSVKIY